MMLKRLIQFTLIFVAIGFAMDARAAVIFRPVHHFGLVGYWDFQEGAGDKAYDKSGYDNDGTLEASMTESDWVNGKMGQALDFDGSDDYVDTGDIEFLDGVSEFTLFAWMKRRSASDHVSIVKDLNVNNRLGINFYNDGNVYLNLSQDGQQWGYFSSNDTDWHHVVLVFDGSQSDNAGRLKGYFDGVQQTLSWANTIPAATDDNSASFLFGRSPANSTYTDGSIDEVRIYNRALSAGEVERLYKLSQPTIAAPTMTGLVGYWAFDEGKGAKARDSSFNTNHGDLQNMEESDWVDGKLGTGLNFDSNGEVVTVTQNSINGDQGTTVFWLKPNHAYNDSGGYFFVARFSDYTENDFWVDHWVGNFNFEIVYDGSTGGSRYTNRIQEADLENYWTQNEWMHIVCTWDKNLSSNTMNIYINGVRPPQSSPGTWSNSWVPPTTIYIGNDGENSNIDPADGIIDEVRIYDRALEANEIEALYKSGLAKINASQNDKLTDGLVGLWSFNGPDMDGNEAYDRSGQNNHGTLQNGPIRTIGRIGQALDFDGDDTYVELPSPSDLFTDKAGTFAAWIYTIEGASGGYGGIIEKVWGSSFQNRIAIRESANGLRFQPLDWTETSLDCDNVIVYDSWQHIVITSYEENNTLYTKFYIDGQEECSSENPELYFSSGTSSKKIGRNQSNIYHFKGIIDEARIYNRILSAQEIQRLYNMGR